MHAVQAQKNKAISKKIIISVEGSMKNRYLTNPLTLEVVAWQQDRFIYPPQKRKLPQQLKNGVIQWVWNADELQMIAPGLFTNRGLGYILEPGDSICLREINGKLRATGIGVENIEAGKLVESFLDILKRAENLSEKRGSAASLKDYLDWSAYLNQKTNVWLPLLDNYKNKLSKSVYMIKKGTLLTAIEKIRMHKFHSIRRATIVSEINQFGLSNEDLCEIYDTTMNSAGSKWLRYERDFIFDPDYAWEMLHDENYRVRGKFFKTKESDTAILGKDPEDPFIWQYNQIKKRYKGIVRENFMVFTLSDPRGVLRQVGFTPKVEAILADYYTQPGYPEAKKQVKDYELERRAKAGLKNAPDFSLTDTKGKEFNSKQLKGKVAVVDFWFTGCTGCVQMAPALRKVEEHFAKDTNMVFLSVSIDKSKEQWLKSIQVGKYTSGTGVQLYTGGEGDKHKAIKGFLVQSYPTLELIGPDGSFLQYDKRKIDPRSDKGAAMITFLQKQLITLKDGPYVFYDKDKVTAFSIDGNKVDKTTFNKASPSVLKVQTDEVKSFNVNLMPSLNVQSAVYPKAEKLFILCDSEGNFDAFRKLLQKNKIVDENLDWTFGNGHLVFGGDMFDRGRQVTECLWLIYSLEEKAKAAGGYVHFVLGNHEIMNMMGDHGYVEAKYKGNAALMGKTLIQLYNEDSELGRWLRTKNIVEKVGDILFLHGGISRKLNNLPVTVADINQLARPNYAISKKDYRDERTNSIMSSSTGPFWYRTYYDDKKDMPQIIDSTLQKFNVKHIVTGHTIVADTISIHYGGKVINTDTKHAEGKSEALLIEGDKFYRVNSEGKKVLLFTDDKRKVSGK
jgi:cytochrome oxidase Cu insertion factor (SCO1/SenC/PrrC family)